MVQYLRCTKRPAQMIPKRSTTISYASSKPVCQVWYKVRCAFLDQGCSKQPGNAIACDFRSCSTRSSNLPGSATQPGKLTAHRLRLSAAEYIHALVLSFRCCVMCPVTSALPSVTAGPSSALIRAFSCPSSGIGEHQSCWRGLSACLFRRVTLNTSEGPRLG